MVPTLTRIVDWEIVNFVLFCGFLMDLNCQKALSELTHLGIQSYASWNLSVSFFSIKAAVDSFELRRDISILDTSKKYLNILIGILTGQKSQKCFSSDLSTKIHLILLKNADLNSLIKA